jgi:hypothetical protein
MSTVNESYPFPDTPIAHLEEIEALLGIFEPRY